MPENIRIADDPDAALHAIQAAYVRQLPERLRELGACMQQCMEEPGVAAHHELLLMKLHRLAGSAGTFGFAELGQRATELEILLGSFIEDSSANEFAPVAAGIHALLRWADDQNLSQLAPRPAL